MQNYRKNKIIFMNVVKENVNVRNSFRRMLTLVQDSHCEYLMNGHIGKAKPAISLIDSKLFESEKEKWKHMLVRDQSVGGKCGNKLRTYRPFKSDFEIEK
jgi:hypothetical protein